MDRQRDSRRTKQSTQNSTMWRTPMVSIIVPVYNVETYLAACVESIYAQTFTDYELLLIDDASTDSSGKLADEFARCDPRARVIHLQKNGGLGSARNRGVGESIGKYLTFIDSDDWVKPGYLSSLVTVAETSHADVVRMGHEYEHLQEDGSWESGRVVHLTKTKGFMSTDRKKRMELMTHYSLCNTAWATLIQRNLFLENNLHFESILSEDILFSFQLLYTADRYVLIPAAEYCYRQTSTSIMHIRSLSKSRKAIQSLMQAAAFVERDLKRMTEFQDSPELIQSIREWFVDAYLRWLWLKVSDGLDRDAVLAEANAVFHEVAPEQAGILGFLLKAWLEQFAKKNA